MRYCIALFFYALALLLTLTACDSMISEVEVPSSEPKLVVTGFLSPDDDTIHIVVSKSRPLNVPYQGWDYSFPVVNNARVTLSDGISTIVLPFNTPTGNYVTPSASMPVVAGNTYSLLVTTPDGYRATSSCTVPVETAPEVEITGIDSTNEYSYWSRNVSLRFRDLPGAGHFYRITAGTFYQDEYNYQSSFIETGFDRGEPYVSDKNKDGEYFLYRTWDIDSYSVADTLYVSMLITDEGYYNYHRSVNTFGGDNPFAEPTPVFSNIDGGLGIFAAVNGKITAFPLKTNK